MQGIFLLDFLRFMFVIYESYSHPHSGGGDRSGIYVALSDLIQQAKCDERVDVFQTTKYARAQRHCLLQTIVSYPSVSFLYVLVFIALVINTGIQK